MADELLAQAATPGNYLAIWKIVIFIICFGLWAWTGQWLDKDAPYVRANRNLWNNVYFGTGIVAGLLWFILPAPFFVNLMLYLVACGTVTIAYVFHRNARVTSDERILTVDHIKSLFSKEHRVKESKQRVIFVTANKNQLPVPLRQEPVYDSYVLSEELIYDMAYRRVTQADLIPTGEQSQLRYLIDGVPGVGGEKTRLETELILSYLKEVAGMDVKDRRRPQTGRFSTRVDNNDILWRLKTAGSTRGEQMLLERIEKSRALGLDDLGFNPDQIESLREVLAQPMGVVLVSGIHGSGVTTTLYAMARSHDAFLQNIHSLEIETLRDLENITQHKIDNTNPERNAIHQLQAMLRGDPDVAMVGFFDQPELAKHISKYASEGRKAYVAVTAPSTFDVLQMWVSGTDNPDRVATTLLAVTSQKLFRVLCTQCRQAYMPDGALLKKLNLPVEKIKNFYRPPNENELEYDKKGNVIPCSHCQGTGYYGRTAVFETLFITDQIRQLIRENAPINAIRAQSRKDKMRYLQEQILRKVIDGTTSIQEMLRVTAGKTAKTAGESPAPTAPQNPQ
jgi:type II secretory ATPase GspE/PulE/Tfp pilus assembly ATPase PilB-like protein